MNTVEVTVPELLKGLLGAPWREVTGPGNDHPLEDAELPDQPNLLFRRKKANPDQMYYEGMGRDWTCAKCGAGILGGRVAHTVLDGLFPCSGSGEVSYETVPYCPICEKEPAFHGSAISA